MSSRSSSPIFYLIFYILYLYFSYIEIGTSIARMRLDRCHCLRKSNIFVDVYSGFDFPPDSTSTMEVPFPNDMYI